MTLRFTAAKSQRFQCLRVFGMDNQQECEQRWHRTHSKSLPQTSFGLLDTTRATTELGRRYRGPRKNTQNRAKKISEKKTPKKIDEENTRRSSRPIQTTIGTTMT